MRLVGVTMARNEADVLEAFVRHNLTVLDALVVVDHASLDGTEQILASLVREGLPLTAMRDDSPGFPQPAMTNALTRRAFAEDGASFVVPLDADEFLKVPSRPAFEAALGALAPGAHARLEWQTYIPTFDAGADTLAAMRAARRGTAERHGLNKVVVAPSFAGHANATVELGHHAVRAPGPADVAPHVLLSSAVAAIAHVPIRSARQFAAKTAIGWLAALASPAQEPGQIFHWRDSFAYLRSGRPLSPMHLAEVAVNYSLPNDRWLPVDAVTLVDDPFLADFELAYDHFGVSDPLALVLAFLERSLATRGSPQGRAGPA